MQENVQPSEIRFDQFVYPAMCDFTQNLFFIFGIGQMLPDIGMMTKAITLPIVVFFCKWSLLRIRKEYNLKQIIGIVGILVGILVIFFGHVKD
jgi:hypothetical protein